MPAIAPPERPELGLEVDDCVVLGVAIALDVPDAVVTATELSDSVGEAIEEDVVTDGADEVAVAEVSRT